MIQTIEIDEADSGLGTYGGVPEDQYAGEVFIGGTKQRPLVIEYWVGDEDMEWWVEDITLFHPDERREEVTWDELCERMSYKEVAKMTDYICELVRRQNESARDSVRELNP